MKRNLQKVLLLGLFMMVVLGKPTSISAATGKVVLNSCVEYSANAFDATYSKSKMADLNSATSLTLTDEWTVSELNNLFRYVKGNSSLKGTSNQALLEFDMNGASITSTGNNIDHLFSGCKKLATIKLPSVGFECADMIGAFLGCTNLTSIVNFDKLTGGSNGVNLNATFKSCSSLNSITFPVSGFKVNDLNGAFWACSSLTNMPENFDKVSAFSSTGGVSMDWTFSGCVSLQEIILPEGLVVNDMDNTFSACSNVEQIVNFEKIIIPSGIKLLCMGLFCGDRKLTQVIFPFSPSKIDATRSTQMFTYGVADWAMYDANPNIVKVFLAGTTSADLAQLSGCGLGDNIVSAPANADSQATLIGDRYLIDASCRYICDYDINLSGKPASYVTDNLVAASVGGSSDYAWNSVVIPFTPTSVSGGATSINGGPTLTDGTIFAAIFSGKIYNKSISLGNNRNYAIFNLMNSKDDIKANIPFIIQSLTTTPITFSTTSTSEIAPKTSTKLGTSITAEDGSPAGFFGHNGNGELLGGHKVLEPKQTYFTAPTTDLIENTATLGTLSKVGQGMLLNTLDPIYIDVPDTPTAINELSSDSIKVAGGNNVINIIGGDKANIKVAVYTLDGKVIYQGNSNRIDVENAGIYIVNLNGVSCKVFVR